MKAEFVLDSSTTLAWCFADEASEYADAVLVTMNRKGCVVPSVWPLEVANILAISERRGRIDPEKLAEALGDLDLLPIHVDPETTHQAFRDILKIAREHRITAYDAAYLELALREGLPLASLDEPMKRVALHLGIKMFVA